MVGIYVFIIAAVLVVLFLITKRRKYGLNHKASITKDEKALLDQDYLSHGKPNNNDDGKNI